MISRVTGEELTGILLTVDRRGEHGKDGGVKHVTADEEEQEEENHLQPVDAEDGT